MALGKRVRASREGIDRGTAYPVDEAVKLIMSLGVVVPTWTKHEVEQLPLREPGPA